MSEYVCARCHYDGPPRRIKRGSTRTEAMMWMMFPFGLPYTFWRMLTKIPQCRHCDSRDIYPVTTAMGKRLLADPVITPPPLSPSVGLPHPLLPAKALDESIAPTPAPPVPPASVRAPRHATASDPEAW